MLFFSSTNLWNRMFDKRRCRRQIAGRIRSPAAVATCVEIFEPRTVMSAIAVTQMDANVLPAPGAGRPVDSVNDDGGNDVLEVFVVNRPGYVEIDLKNWFAYLNDPSWWNEDAPADAASDSGERYDDFPDAESDDAFGDTSEEAGDTEFINDDSYWIIDDPLEDSPGESEETIEEPIDSEPADTLGNTVSGELLIDGDNSAVDAPIEGIISGDNSHLPSVSLDNGVLTIVGTDGADELIVETEGELVAVLIDYTAHWTFSLDTVHELHVDLGAGDDRISTWLHVPTILIGGDGNDMLHCEGTANDTLDGGEGVDHISGYFPEDSFVTDPSDNIYVDSNLVSHLPDVEELIEVDGNLLPSVILDNGMLIIFGTNGRDGFSIDVQGDQVYVLWLNQRGPVTPMSWMFSLDSVHEIQADLGAGSDYAHASVDVPTRLFGGDGRDQLECKGACQDTIDGGEGMDVIYGPLAGDIYVVDPIDLIIELNDPVEESDATEFPNEELPIDRDNPVSLILVAVEELEVQFDEPVTDNVTENDLGNDHDSVADDDSVSDEFFSSFTLESLLANNGE